MASWLIIHNNTVVGIFWGASQFCIGLKFYRNYYNFEPIIFIYIKASVQWYVNSSRVQSSGVALFTPHIELQT